MSHFWRIQGSAQVVCCCLTSGKICALPNVVLEVGIWAFHNGGWNWSLPPQGAERWSLPRHLCLQAWSLDPSDPPPPISSLVLFPHLAVPPLLEALPTLGSSKESDPPTPALEPLELAEIVSAIWPPRSIPPSKSHGSLLERDGRTEVRSGDHG